MKTLIIATLVLAFESVLAQPNIDWYKISGGGGTSTGGGFQLSGTIGQPEAGVALSGGEYSITGGFWSLINVVQTAGAPRLHLSHSGSTLTVYWQNTAGWTLQQSANLAPAGWTNASWTTNSGTCSLTISNPSGNLFFRLKQ